MHPDATQRAHACLEWLRQGVSEDNLQLIRSQVAQERTLGDAKFQAMVEKTPGRPLHYTRTGGRDEQPQTSDAPPKVNGGRI